MKWNNIEQMHGFEANGYAVYREGKGISAGNVRVVHDYQGYYVIVESFGGNMSEYVGRDVTPILQDVAYYEFADDARTVAALIDIIQRDPTVVYDIDVCNILDGEYMACYYWHVNQHTDVFQFELEDADGNTIIDWRGSNPRALAQSIKYMGNDLAVTNAAQVAQQAHNGFVEFLNKRGF